MNTLIAVQNSFSLFDTIVMYLYGVYLNLGEFFYFYSNSLLPHHESLFILDKQIFVFFNDYVSYKNFISNSLCAVILRNVEFTIFFTDFNNVNLLSLLSSV